MWTRCLVVLLALMPLVGSAQVGTVSVIEGTANVVGTDQAERSLSLGSDIMLNDRVSTLASSKLEIKLQDDTVISMGELSEMVIDEYVVNPQEPSSSKGSVKLLKGLFRMITGQVTKLNPDQFRVRTRVATIGIRGCDVGYEVSDEDVNVMAMHFGPGESLVVRMIDPARRETAGGWDGITDGDWNLDPGLWTESHPVDRAGQMVNVNPRSGMRESRMTPQQMRRVTTGVAPSSKQSSEGTDSTGGEGGDATQPADGTDEGNSQSDASGSADQSEATGPLDDSGLVAGDMGGIGGSAEAPQDSSFFDAGLNVGADMPYQPGEDVIAYFPSSLGELNGDIVVVPDGLDLNANSFQPLSDGETSGTGSTDGGNSSGNSSDVPPVQPPPDTPPDDTPATPVFTAFGGGSHWSWGVWEQDNEPQSVEFSGTPLASADVQGMVNGATLYNLSGSGSSAAVVKEGSTRHLLTGTADLSVQIGGAVMPTWDGIFSMGNGQGDSLDFSATGSIQQDGSLQGNQQSYQLTVGGHSYDRSSITFEDIHGYLVGDPLGAPPVSGAVGSFQFDHGSAATVQGGFGADLH